MIYIKSKYGLIFFNEHVSATRIKQWVKRNLDMFGMKGEIEIDEENND